VSRLNCAYIGSAVDSPIESPQQRAKQHTAAAAAASGPVFDRSGNFVMIEKLKFEVKGGADITKENTDAVVNSTNDRLDLTQGRRRPIYRRVSFFEQVTDNCMEYS
jgi:hypothetical protein